MPSISRSCCGRLFLIAILVMLPAGVLAAGEAVPLPIGVGSPPAGHAARFVQGNLILCADAAADVRAVSCAARPLPLSAVRLTGGPLKHAQDLDADYLLKLEPDRMLAYFRQRAGLQPKAKGYGGWDGDGKNLTGHIAGHYLSAVSLMWAATGDPRFKDRADYLVKELREVQEKQGDGYLGALADGKRRFAEVARGEIRSGGFDLNGLWSPWYVLHKMYAGLRDAYRYTGNRTALEMEVKFAAWAESVLAKLSDVRSSRCWGRNSAA